MEENQQSFKRQQDLQANNGTNNLPGPHQFDSQRSSIAMNKKAGVTVSFNFFSGAGKEELSPPMHHGAAGVHGPDPSGQPKLNRGMPYQTSYDSFQKMK